MKKILTMMLCIVLLLPLLSGCKKLDNKDDANTARNVVFTGVIENVGQNSILVTTTDDVGFDKAQVSLASVQPGFTLLAGQTVKITILPEIAESYPVQATAVSIELVAEPGLSNPEYPDYTASFYRADSTTDGGGEFILAQAKNPKTILISSVRHIPVMVLESTAELNDFIHAGEAYFQFNVAYNEEKPLADALKQYGDDFFKDHRLVILYAQESSGSTRHEIEDATLYQNTLSISVKSTTPQSHTDDMADWFILLEFKKNATASCTTWDAYYTD